MTGQVYLDYNATARVRPEVVARVAETLAEVGNASSVHAAGRAARAVVEAARRDVAALVGARPAQVVFTSGGTEADNQAMRASAGGQAFVSAIEHPAVLDARPDAIRVPVTADGVIDLGALDRMLGAAENPGLVAVMLANNETGVIQPVTEATAIAHRHGARLHCDAVQAVGKIAVDFDSLGCDTLAATAHKFGGPQGIGALIVRDPDTVGCFLRGGGQERGLRGGTEPVALIAGFGRAAALAAERMGDYERLRGMRDRLEAQLRRTTPGLRIFGEAAPRLPNTSKLAMPGVGSETQVMSFDLAGICVSAGSACSAGRVEPPYVLTAMGVPDADALCALRVSLGWGTTEDDIRRFVEVWGDIRARAGAAAPGRAAE